RSARTHATRGNGRLLRHVSDRDAEQLASGRRTAPCRPAAFSVHHDVVLPSDWGVETVGSWYAAPVDDGAVVEYRSCRTAAMRLKAEIWIKAYLRRCNAEGAFAVVVRHGDDDAGAIFIKVLR